MAGGNQENEHRENGVGRNATEQTSEETASGQTASGETASGQTGSAGPDCVEESVDEEYLEELPDGSGCVEIWEHLADRRGDQG